MTGLFEATRFNSTASPGFAAWLAEHDVALAFTTGIGLMFAGVDPEGRLRVTEHVLDGSSGLAVAGDRSLYVALRWQLWRFENALTPGERDRTGHDRVYLPQSAWTTGFLGAYDLALDDRGRPLFSSALCNCVATVAERWSFTAVWRPPFISALATENRCHLTGLAVEAGEPAYATCAAVSDVKDGWKERLSDGGVVVDARNGAIVASGLSLPHSPRLHDGRLFLAESGRGRLVTVDVATGEVAAVATLPGLARGLALVDGYAVVGCSRASEDEAYADLPIAALPPDEQRHGVMVVDLATGEIAERLTLEASSGEVFALAPLAGCRYGRIAEPPGGVREVFAPGPAP